MLPGGELSVLTHGFQVKPGMTGTNFGNSTPFSTHVTPDLIWGPGLEPQSETITHTQLMSSYPLILNQVQNDDKAKSANTFSTAF